MTALLDNPLTRRPTHANDLWRMAVDAWAADAVDPVEELREDRTRIFQPLNVTADKWQREVLNSTSENLMLLCSRQAGKSFTMSALALLEALLHPWSEVLIVSRSLRQSIELLRKVKEIKRGLTGERVHRRKGFVPKTIQAEVAEVETEIKARGWDGAALLGGDYQGKIKDKALTMELPNGSRITSLPGNPDTIVGFSSVTLLILDEGSRVPDQLLNVVRPFLAASEATHGRPGRLVAASTPFGKRGWFWEAYDRNTRAEAAYQRGVRDRANGVVRCNWSEADPDRFVERQAWLQGNAGQVQQLPWHIVKVTADQCPRISQKFLDNERAQIGDRWFRQEYMCSFEDTTDAVFSHEVIQGMLDESYEQFKLWCE